MKVKKAVIPAAGLGTRFLPITKAVPKPMLPVLDKPTIQYICEELTRAGIDDITIVVSPDSDVIKRHFGAAPALEKALIEDGKTKLYEVEQKTRSFNVRFVEQKVPNGLAGAILCAEEFIKGEPFALLLGDELLYAGENEKSCMEKLVDAYEKTGKTVLCAMEFFGDDLSKYGNIGVSGEDGDIINVSAMIEKPSVNEALSNYAIIGRYVIAPEVLDVLKTLKPHGREICPTDAYDELAKAGKVVAVRYAGKRYDVGDKFGYLKANAEFSLMSKEIGESAKEYFISLAEKLKN